MKICTGATKKPPTFADLRPGDVFTIASEHPGADTPRMKTQNNGVVYLDVGEYFPKGLSASTVVFRYPNACLTLGEPE